MIARLSILVFVSLGCLFQAQAADRALDFEADIRPLLSRHCFACHGKRKQEGGLRLDGRSRMLKGGRRGPVIVPGDPTKSLLVLAVSGEHDELRMPPKKKLEPRELGLLRRWVKQGAHWPNTPQGFFRTKIRPTLEKHCFDCHGGAAKGGLKLTTREMLLRGGKSGPAVLPGQPERSLLMKLLQHQDKRKMPPAGRLPDPVIADFGSWIRDGAVWSSEEGPAANPTISPAQRAFWSFQPVATPQPPMVSDARWQGNPIDRFVFAKLRSKRLNPVKRASRRELIRRASFDLIGLPPTSTEVQSFLADQQPRAYERLVERLLASRHYGERWGRHWLDVVRYADTAGDAADFPVPEAYKYRDYVIRAFNQDKPYDQFLREQLAGDLLPFKDDDQHWEQTIATGYLAISRRIGVSPQNLKHITIEDTIDNVGKTMLGLSLGCARCHDHKFDPIPTSDYYALYGIFASSVYPHAGAEHLPYRQNFVYRIGKQASDEVLAPFRRQLAEWDKKERTKFEEYRALQKMRIIDRSRTREVIWNEVLAIREQRRPVAESFPDLQIAYAIQDGEARDARVQRGGNPRTLGPFVRRGFLQVLGGAQLPEKVQGSGRLQLAEWIATKQNPLTARVMVNRIWHHHFGRGLVSSTSDFGIRGSRPSHPQLLDFLASYFVKQGWSIKQMHRLIMLSETYQLAGVNQQDNYEIDPTNEFRWRFDRRRLDAHQIRDAMLMIAGQLDLSPGGRHPFPHRLTYFYRQHEPFSEKYSTRRRSVYMMQQRIQKDPYLDLFDGPDGNLPLSERQSTTTTLQALFLMNSQMLERIARSTAQRLLSAMQRDGRRIGWVYQNIFGRPPSDHELARTTRYLRKARAHLADAPAAAKNATNESEMVVWAGLVRAMLSSNEFLFVE